MTEVEHMDCVKVAIERTRKRILWLREPVRTCRERAIDMSKEAGRRTAQMDFWW